MLRQTGWTTIRVRVKRRQRTRQIARTSDRSPTTVARILRERVDRPPAPHRRVSNVNPYRPRIQTEFNVGRSASRILERMGEDWQQSGITTHTNFKDGAGSIRRTHARQPGAAGIPIRCERLPAELIQRQWREIPCSSIHPSNNPTPSPRPGPQLQRPILEVGRAEYLYPNGAVRVACRRTVGAPTIH
jgi:hypothetical protein